jgi:hypothetical protein
MPISSDMRVPLPKVSRLVLAIVFALATAETAAARPRKHRVERSAAPSITRDCGGTPIIMQGLECPKGSVRDEDRPTRRAERPRAFPRGSGGAYQPLVPSPGGLRSPTLQPAVGPYQPPPINSFSDRATQCVHSFPLNAGLGNNPTNRDAYVRSCVNN